MQTSKSWLVLNPFLCKDVGFILVFSDIHLWASIFSVILVNYIFMDGKCDYFQGELSGWALQITQHIELNATWRLSSRFVHRDSSGRGLPHPIGPVLLRPFTTLLLIHSSRKPLQPLNLTPVWKKKTSSEVTEICFRRTGMGFER